MAQSEICQLNSGSSTYNHYAMVNYECGKVNGRMEERSYPHYSVGDVFVHEYKRGGGSCPMQAPCVSGVPIGSWSYETNSETQYYVGSCIDFVQSGKIPGDTKTDRFDKWCQVHNREEDKSGGWTKVYDYYARGSQWKVNGFHQVTPYPGFGDDTSCELNLNTDVPYIKCNIHIVFAARTFYNVPLKWNLVMH